MSRGAVTIHLVGLAMLCIVGAASAACDDAVALTSARAAVEAACPCDAATRQEYRACVAAEIRRLKAEGAPSADCGRAVRRCAARSTCGRPERVACCRSRRDGSAACRITTAERCLARGGCQAQYASCCDACAGSGCATSTTSTTTSSTTTTLAAVCGNGVIEPGEWCDGDEFCASNCAIERVACCSIATPSGTCSADVPAFTLFAQQATVCDPSAGGTFRLGLVAAAGAACPDAPGGPGIPASSSVGDCVTPPPLTAPASICCQDTATSCSDITTTSREVVTTFVWSCLYTHYPNYPVVAGTCSGGRCVPAH
jgi:hypothetical protein